MSLTDSVGDAQGLGVGGRGRSGPFVELQSMVEGAGGEEGAGQLHTDRRLGSPDHPYISATARPLPFWCRVSAELMSLSNDRPSGSSTTRAARLPTTAGQARPSLSPSDLGSLAPEDRLAVEKLLAPPALDQDWLTSRPSDLRSGGRARTRYASDGQGCGRSGSPSAPTPEPRGLPGSRSPSAVPNPKAPPTDVARRPRRPPPRAMSFHVTAIGPGDDPPLPGRGGRPAGHDGIVDGDPFGKVAGRPVTAPSIDDLRPFLGAPINRLPAPGPEPAAARRVDAARDIALEEDPGP